MIPYLSKLALDWIQFYSKEHHVAADQDPLLIYDAIIKGNEHIGWELIVETLNLAEDSKALHMLAAGPFENFMAYCGDKWVDTIVAEVETNPRIGWLLGALSRKSLSSLAWAKIIAVRSNEWLPFGSAPILPDRAKY